MNIKLVTPDQTQLLPGVARLLQDIVHGGASVGFLAPLSQEAALSYWQSVYSSLDDGLRLWVVLDGEDVIGSVQLDLCHKENGKHRAEIQKLFVLSSHQGRGISKQLMSAAEEEARKLNRTLLILDTQAGSTAEAVYRHMGWTPVGAIPDFAASPDGQLQPTVYFYKRIAKTLVE